VTTLLLVGCAGCSLARAPAPLPNVAPTDPRPRVLLSRPGEGHVVRLPVALAEIAGAALTPNATRHDVVLALDFSNSAFEPTGRDVDGDGVIGARKAWQPTVGGLRSSPLDWTTDPDDSVAGAELAAARTLLLRLDASTTRVALVSFGSSVHTLLPLTTPEAALAALDGADLGAQIGGTNVWRALVRAAQILDASPDSGAQRSILLITDGFPNLPPPQQRAEDLVSEQAERLAAAGVRVHVLAIAAQVEPRPVLEELGRVTNGSFESLTDPTELPVLLANTSLSPIQSVEVRNATTGAAGLAVRVLPDGRFDAIVKLAPGENVIEVRALAAAGASEVARRTLRYEPPAAAAARTTPEAAELLETLRRRTAELELLAELRARRQQQRRELRIEPTRP
jgi:von Willebrand factor type A domain